MFKPLRHFGPLVLAALLLAIGAARAESPSVVASIKPVHSLVAGVMQGVGTPELLVRGAASPHVYSLRPSDAKRLGSAGLVFWIGPIYEGFLARPLATLAGEARVVTLMEAPGVELLAARTGGAWEEEAEHRHGHSHADGHGHEEDDGHLWLDPANAKAIVAATVAALAAADPGNASRYRDNGAALSSRLDALDAELRARLAPVAGRPFVVFHDAYQYFERRYGLAAAGSITVTPESKPGARRVKEIRAKIGGLGAHCVFSEPQFEPSLVATLIAGSDARTGVLDPLGADIPDGPELYFTMMRRLADALLGCLG